MFGAQAQRHLARSGDVARQLQADTAGKGDLGATRGGAGLYRQEVHLRAADEARDEQVLRPVIQFQRAADLFDMARRQHHDLVGHGHGFT